jgi:hypothetical protein
MRVIGVTYGTIFVAIVAVAGLVAWVFVKQQPQASAPAAAVSVAPIPMPPLAPASAGPMTFRDPDNTQRYLALQTAQSLVRQKLAVFGDAKTLPADDLDGSCAEIAGLAAALAGEPHPAVQKAADAAVRLCDYDRPLAALHLVLRLLHGKGANKKSLCTVASRWTARLMEKKYGDDEQVKLVLADVGMACL